MAAIIPIIMGGRVLQVAAPRALALIEAGVARYLPSMRTVGSQSAGANAAGPFYRAGSANLPAMADRPGLIGRGLAGGVGLGAMAMDRPEAVVPSEPMPVPVRSMDSTLYGEDVGPRPAPAPASVPMPVTVRSTDSTLYGEDVGPRPASIRMSDSTLAGYDMPPEKAARNAVRVAQSVMPRTSAPASVSAQPTNEGFLSRLFGGPDYQSMNALAEGPARGYGARVVQDGRINWGDPESAADFVRADRADMAMRAGRAEGGGIPEGMMGARPMSMPSLDMPAMDQPAPMGDMPPLGAMGPSGKPAAGAGAGGRDAAINKALEIIHHLVIRGR